MTGYYNRMSENQTFATFSIFTPKASIKDCFVG